MADKNSQPVLYPLDRNMQATWFVKYKDSATGKPLKKYGLLNKLPSLAERLIEADRIIINEIGVQPTAISPNNTHAIVALVQQFFSYKLIGKRFKSIVTYEKHVNEFVLWYRTTGHHFDLDIMGIEFLGTLNAKGLSGTTVNAYRTTLKSVFAKIQKAKKIDINPFELTTKLKENRQTKDWFRQEQIDHLKSIISATDPQLWLCCRLQFYCFIRPCQEMTNLKVGDVDIFERKIRIRPEFGKMGNADEYVQIPDCLLAELEPLTAYPPHYYLFGVNGLPATKKIGRDTLSRRHNAILRSHQYPRGYSTYSWKNTGAVHMLKAGISILHISNMMRHKSLDYTRGYFKSLGFSDIRQEIQKQLPQI
jgi:integrase